MTPTFRLALLLLLALPGCRDEGPPPKTRGGGSGAPLPTERLHPPGELRLTSAGQEPRLRLRYRLADGQVQGYRTSVSATHRAAGQTSRLSAEFDWERAVDDPRDGTARVTMRVRRVRYVRPTTIRDTVAPALRQLTLTTRLDPRGRVQKLAPASSLPGFQGPNTLARFTAPLPKDAVGDGATWERSESLPLQLPKSRQRVRLGVRTRYRLKLVRHRGTPVRAQISATLRLVVSTPGPGALTGQKVTGGGTGTAELTLDLRRGELTAGKSEQDLRLTVTGYGRSQPLEQKLRTRTRAVHLRPRRPRPRHRPRHHPRRRVAP